MINNKFLTRLLDKDYRNKILTKISDVKKINLQINAYARYLSDMQIISRDKNLEKDKFACYGFSPITVVCYVNNDDKIISQFFELRPVNHYLAKFDGDSAVEVLKCILIELYLQNKNTVKDFNVDKIDRYLAKLENDYNSVKLSSDLSATTNSISSENESLG